MSRETFVLILAVIALAAAYALIFVVNVPL